VGAGYNQSRPGGQRTGQKLASLHGLCLSWFRGTDHRSATGKEGKRILRWKVIDAFTSVRIEVNENCLGKNIRGRNISPKT
jgi:hypothetical protein